MNRRQKMRLVVAALSMITTSAFAEGGCPSGQFPQVGQGWRGCTPPTQPTAPTMPRSPRWDTRWQAIATDTPKGILGKSVDRLSAVSAENDALEDCQAQGGTSCKISISYSNGCVAMVVGKSLLTTGYGATSSDAEQDAIRECEKGSLSCAVYYSACSLPVRVQ